MIHELQLMVTYDINAHFLD